MAPDFVAQSDARGKPPGVVTRFAPSPTGYLHLGHAYSALFSAAAARAVGGRFLLRIEDIDSTRCKPVFEQAILEDLEWLGLDWERPVLRQSEHFDRYRTQLNRLKAIGMAYPCFCSRKEIEAEIARAGGAPHGPEGAVYPGTCKTLSLDERAARLERGEAHAWRLDAAAATARTGELAWHEVGEGEQPADLSLTGDAVLWRKETPSSYHLSVTIDDGEQGVSLVTRGEDLRHATAVHRHLQALLGIAVPRYRHHRLLTGPAGDRLAKRDKSLTIRALREKGHTPAEVRAMAGADRLEEELERAG